MLLLEANHLNKSYRDRQIVSCDHLEVRKTDRIGIVGRNGAGKTTLLRLLAGLEEPDTGSITRWGEITFINQFEEMEHLHTNARARKEWSIPTDSVQMSGGEFVRMKIAHALGQQAPILFADEPTSHLDLSGIKKLEEVLRVYDGAVVVISHDRSFLDEVCTRIIEIEEASVREWKGNYSDYRSQKEKEQNRAYQEYEEYSKEVERLNKAIVEKKQQAKGMTKPPKRMSTSESRLHKDKAASKISKVNRNAKAMETRLEKLEQKEKPRELPRVQFDVHYTQKLHHKYAIQLTDVTKHAGDRQLFAPFSGAIRMGAKVAVIGENGAGKSSFLQMIIQAEPGIEMPQQSRIGYFHQSLAILDQEKTIVQNVMESSSYPESFVRTVLSRLLFKRDEVFKKVGVLSGGERGKVALAKVFLGDYNMLILDEPTNFLDIPTQEELEQLLRDYPGTILFATHDRTLIRKVADTILLLEEGQARLFHGTFDQFQQPPSPSGPGNDRAGVNRLLLETQLTEVIGRLSIQPKDSGEKQQLEERYQQLLQQLKSLS